MPDAELKDRIYRVLANEGTLSWEELLAKLPEGLTDDEVEDAVSELQIEEQIRHSGRDGGFQLIDPPAVETSADDVTTTVEERDGTVTAEFTVSATVTIEIDGRRLGGGKE